MYHSHIVEMHYVLSEVMQGLWDPTPLGLQNTIARRDVQVFPVAYKISR